MTLLLLYTLWFNSWQRAMCDCSDGTSQQTSSLSRAEPSDFGLELFKPKASKIKLFKPDNSKNSSFSSLAKKDFFSVFYSKDTLYKYFYSLRISVGCYFYNKNDFCLIKLKKIVAFLDFI
jgi:hypothetical protein